MFGHFLAILAAQTLQPAVPPAAPPVPSIPAAMPADLLAAFADAEAALASVSGCFGNGSVMTPQRLAGLDRRMIALRREANGVWGPEALSMLPVAAPGGDCDRSGGAAVLASAAEMHLAALTAKLGGALTPMRGGVWFGTMPLCGAGPVRSELMVDLYTADEFLIITLDPAKAAELTQLTSGQVGHALALRGAGRVISELLISRPIVGGQLQIGGPDRSELQLVQTALKNCPKIAP